VSVVERYGELLVGSIDCCVHASPDCFPRSGDDFALVRDLRAAGLRAAVHRHHFTSTSERSRLVRDQTGSRRSAGSCSTTR